MSYRHYGSNIPERKTDVVPYEYYSKHRGSHRSYHTKGKLPEQNLNVSVSDDENPYLLAEESDKKQRTKTGIIVKAVITLVCIAAALGMNFLSFRLPYTPDILTVEFSAFPELLACLVVHPLAALFVIILKNGAYLAIGYSETPTVVASVANKTLLDIIFVLLVWLIFRLIIHSEFVTRRAQKRENIDRPVNAEVITVLVSSIIAAVIVSLVSVITFKKLLLPILLNVLGDDGYINLIYYKYQQVYGNLAERFGAVQKIMPKLTSFRAGMIIFNIPMSVFKYAVSGILASVGYILLQDFAKKE